MKRDPGALPPVELAERVGKATGIQAEKVTQTADELFGIITREINVRGSFKIQGFGTFKKVFVPPPVNTASEDETERPPHYKVKFTPASALAERINKPYAHLKPQVLAEDISGAGRHAQAAPAQPGEPVPVPEAAAPPEVQTVREEKDTVMPAADDRTAATVNQTVQHAVIEQQIIRQQIIHQQIINQIQPETERNAIRGQQSVQEHDTDGSAGINDTYVNRCWFLAGAAVVLTVLILGFLTVTLIRMNRPGAPSPAMTTAAAAKRTVRELPAGEHTVRSAAPAVLLTVAADDNLYAVLAEEQYGMRSLWPYIFSANMLRFSDPDRPGAARRLVVPQKPDMRIDRKDIELSVIDVYDAYRTLILKQPDDRTAQLRRAHAVTSLVCGESLYPGFIRRYAARFDPADVRSAEEQIHKAAAR